MNDSGPSIEKDIPCSVCGNDFDFILPAAVVEAAQKGRLVIFAGAGVSTEESNVFPYTFFDEIKSKISSIPEIADFPSVMSAYEAEFGRQKLVEVAIKRLRAAETFPAIKSSATHFHRELATISPIREIITTNWDPFFENECGAHPIVVDGDYAFYNIPGRKVYKIHGSIGNISTLVATKEDYSETEERLRISAVGGTLRHLLATKVIVFVGYSLRDADFRNVYEPLMASMGKLKPVSFFVGPFDSPEANALGLRHLKTSGTNFLRSLKAHLVESEDLLDDQVIERARRAHRIVLNAYTQTLDMNWREHPELVFSLSYQDGLIDALNRIMSQWMTGEYTDPGHISHTVDSYERLLHTAIERRRFYDGAYIHGYLNGLSLLLMDDEAIDTLPLYETFEDDEFFETATAEDLPEGDEESLESSLQPEPSDLPSAEETDDTPAWSQLLSEAQLLDYLDGVLDTFPAMSADVDRILKGIPIDMVPTHTPFLGGVIDPE